MAETEAPQHSHGTGIEKSLQTKVGGIPAWGIGVGLTGLLLLILWYRNKKAAAAGADANAVVPDTSASETGLDGSTNDALAGVDSTAPQYPVGLTAQGSPSPQTNAQWARLVLDNLVAKGDDPSLISNALNKYLAGEGLSAAEQGVINNALTFFGAPPEGVLPVNTTTPPVTVPPSGTPVGTKPPVGSPKPTPTPTPVPPKVGTPIPQPKFVTVQPWPAALSTLSGIAQAYHTTVANLLKLNPQYVSHPDLTHAGEQVRVS